MKRHFKLFAFASIFTVLSLLPTNRAQADWTNSSITEPGIGCAVLGAAAYLTGQTTQMSVMACVIGGVAGYAMENYYTNKVSDRYENDMKFLKSQMDEVIYQRAVNAAGGKGSEKDVVFKKTVVPSKILPDGTIQLETFHIKATLPGHDMVLGE